MADYSDQIADLQSAAKICIEHRLTNPINGTPRPEYPAWSNAWKACEKVWRSHLELETMKDEDVDDRNFVNWEAERLK
jgi:hypothetical protein